MKIMITLVLLMFQLAVYRVNACTCAIIPPNFCESIVDMNGNIFPDFNIYHVRVDAKDNTGIQVTVLQTFHGEDNTGEQILVVNGIEADCRRNTNDFTVGDEHIFAAWYWEGTWALSICGTTFLDVESDLVTGGVAPGMPTIPLSEFSQLENCGELMSTGSTETPTTLPLVTVQPTLFSDELKLTVANWPASVPLQFSILNTSGQIVYEKLEPAPTNGQQLNVPVNDWDAGVYYLRAIIHQRQEIIKIVKIKN